MYIPAMKQPWQTLRNTYPVFKSSLLRKSWEISCQYGYEITYVNLILENAGWETLNNLQHIFPSFVTLKDRNRLLADIREINWTMAFGLPNDSGQLNLSIRNDPTSRR